MIQENEYRLGNLINPLVGTCEHIGKITSISKNYIGYDLIDDNYEEYLSMSLESILSMVKPIPITEEILLKFGFEGGLWKNKTQTYYSFNGIIVILKDDYYKNGAIFYRNTLLFEEKINLHQLQNLYFALTGQELTFKN